MDKQRAVRWSTLALIVVMGGCDSFASFVNGTGDKGGAGSGVTGTGGKRADAGSPTGTPSGGKSGTSQIGTGGSSGTGGSGGPDTSSVIAASGGATGTGGTTAAGGSAGPGDAGAAGAAGDAAASDVAAADASKGSGGRGAGGASAGGSTGTGGSTNTGGATGAAGSTGMDCTSCHGDSATKNPAPPMDTDGNTATTSPGVGAHAKHLAASTWHRQGKCTDCHNPPTSIPHANGTVDFAWSTPANAGGASPAFSTSSLSCSGVYCHGATMKDQSSSIGHTPVWNVVNGTWNSCGKSCHATPPASSPHTATTTACQTCHGAVIAAFNGANSTWKDATKHVNGTVEATMNCSSCHGSTAPTLPPGDGCHRMVNNNGDRCAACHGAGTSRTQAPATGHNDGKATYSSGSSGGLTFNASTMTCTSSCHGQQRWDGSCSGD